MSIIYKDINLLSQKSAIAGTEKIPVSDTEYVTTQQLAEYGGAPDISSTAVPNVTSEGADVTNLTDVEILAEFSINKEEYEIEEFTADNIWTLSRGKYGMSDVTGTYMSSQSSHRQVLIYMEPGDYIKITPKDGLQAWSAFVNNYKLPVADGPIPFAGNSHVNRIEVGQTVIYKAPEGTVGIRVIIGVENDGVWSLAPKSIVVYRNKAKLTRALVEGNGKREVQLGAIDYCNNTNYNNGFVFRIRKGFSYCVNLEMENNGTDISKLLALSYNVPQNTGFNLYTWTTTTAFTISKGSNFVGCENWSDWEIQDYPGANKTVALGETWGYETIVSASANCVLKNVKVWEIDPYSVEGNWSRIEDRTIKGIARNQSYNEINLSDAIKSDYMINAPFDQFGSGATYKRVVIPVTAGQFVKVIINDTSRSVREFSWLTSNATPVAKGESPTLAGTASFSTVPREVLDGEDPSEIYMQVPPGAKFLSVYMGQNNNNVWPYAPQYLGVSAGEGGSSASSSDEKADIANATVAKRIITQGLLYDLTPVDYTIPTDANGWELPQTVQQLNAIKKSLQCINLTWTPKKNITGKNITYTANVAHTSLPYTSNFQKEKTVGIDVSFHTFMTAVNNPYSLLYTENVKRDTSASAWGETYYGGNGPVYYAQVCCSFTSFVTGRPSTDNNPDFPRSAALFNTYCVAPERKNADTWRIGDVVDNFYHSMLIYGLKRDSSGHVTKIKISESTSSSTFDGNRFREFTPEAFYTYMDTHHTDSPHQVYRLTNFYPNIKYEPSPYVPLTEYGETASTITYNNDICCFAGDKAEFMEGDRVAINYNLTSTPSHSWTSIEVYKDDALYNTYAISSINQSALDTTQKNHALDLGKTLPAGAYKARMTDGSNYSDYTYWEVLADTFTITNNQDGSWSFSADPSTPITFLWIGAVDVPTDLGSFYQRFAREPDWKEKLDNEMRVYIDKTLRDWGRTDPASEATHARILVQGQYGTAIKVKPIPGRS